MSTPEYSQRHITLCAVFFGNRAKENNCVNTIAADRARWVRPAKKKGPVGEDEEEDIMSTPGEEEADIT